MTERNFMFAMLNAVNKDQTTMQWLQIYDSQMTANDANIESNCYTTWNSVLSNLARVVQSDAAKATNTAGKNTLTEAQQQYQIDSTESQTTETSMNGSTQTAQQSVGQDGTNLQNQAQLAATLNSIGQQMAGMISHSYN